MQQCYQSISSISTNQHSTIVVFLQPPTGVKQIKHTRCLWRFWKIASIVILYASYHCIRIKSSRFTFGCCSGDINWRWWEKEGQKMTRKKKMLDDGRCSVKTTWKWIINTFNGYFVDLFNAQRPLPMAKTGQYRAARWTKLDGMLRLRAPTISLSFKELHWALLLECIMADRIRLIECVVLVRSFNCFQFEWWMAAWRINRTKCAMNKKKKKRRNYDGRV